MASGLEQPEPEQIGSAAEELHEAPTIHPAVREIASQVSGMEPAGPSILRATQAYNVLQSGGRALRWMNRDLYSHSAPVSSIQEFWSHSWHGSRYLKTILLMLLYNGPAATVAATLSALVMMSLQATNVLPGYERGVRGNLDAPGTVLVFAPWCTMTAGLVFTIFLLTWRSTRLVFFDQICIHQFDSDLKSQGILSIGAFLKYSEHLLVVWEPTYADRLWCMLELAAFLASHQQPEEKVHIRPTAMAPCILGVACGIWISYVQWILFDGQRVLDILVLVVTRWAFLYMAAAYLREHYRNTEKMLDQLANFAVEKTRCACCSRGHQRPDGSQTICDRHIISQCIQVWYGSVETFDQTVRNDIRIMLYRQLGGFLFPYGWQLVGGVPLLWGFADVAAARARAENWTGFTIFLWGGCTWWFVLFPFIFQMTMLLAKYFRKRESQLWLDRFKTMAVAFLLTLLSFIGIWTSSPIDGFLSASLWVGGSLLLAGTTWLAMRYQVHQMEAKLKHMNQTEHRYFPVIGRPALEPPN